MYLFSGDATNAIFHPMVIHFPIAYLFLALLAELAYVFFRQESLQKITEWLLYLSALSSIVAVGAGVLAANQLGHNSPHHDMVHQHRNIMLAVTAGIVICAILLALVKKMRTGSGRKLLLPILVLLSGMMAFGADKGGEMVYQYGIGTKVGIKSVPMQHDEH